MEKLIGILAHYFDKLLHSTIVVLIDKMTRLTIETKFFVQNPYCTSVLHAHELVLNPMMGKYYSVMGKY